MICELGHMFWVAVRACPDVSPDVGALRAWGEEGRGDSDPASTGDTAVASPFQSGLKSITNTNLDLGISESMKFGISNSLESFFHLSENGFQKG